MMSEQDDFASVPDIGSTHLPSSLNEVVAHVHWLTERVQALEQQLYMAHGTGSLNNLRRVEYKIEKLYVKELSGTLNIGITTIGQEDILRENQNDVMEEDDRDDLPND